MVNEEYLGVWGVGGLYEHVAKGGEVFRTNVRSCIIGHFVAYSGLAAGLAC